MSGINVPKINKGKQRTAAPKPPSQIKKIGGFDRKLGTTHEPKPIIHEIPGLGKQRKKKIF